MGFLAHARKLKEQIEGYRRLEQQLQLFCTTPLLAFSERAAVEFQRLRRHHRRLGTFDPKIAAVVLVNNSTLLSRNLRDFNQIPGLDVQDWTQTEAEDNS